jgi:O-antigen/teichoic acid export membrane protein
VPGLQLTFRGAGRGQVRLFFGYGVALQLTGLLGILVYSAERVAAGALTGVGAVGLLDIGQKFPVMASQLFASGQTSFLTALTHLHAQNRHAEIVGVYARGTRYLNLLNGLAMGFMAPFGAFLIAAWMGHPENFEGAAEVLVYAAVGYHFHALTGPATTYFQGIHQPWRPLWAFLVPQALLGAAILFLALPVLGQGLLAVIVAMAAARVLSSLLFLAQANSALGYSQWRALGYVLLPGLLPYAVGYGLEYAVGPWLAGLGSSRWALLPALAGVGMAYGAAVLLLWLPFSSQDERQWAKRRLLRR